RAAGFLTLFADALLRVVRANCSLARRIWLPSLPLRSGMVVVPTAMRSEGGLAAVGVVTSVIVDNQIVDLDVARHELQYHAVFVEPGGPQENRAVVNGPIEDRLRYAGVR
ncbi:MAG: Na+/H+ antiporter subunit E, partial [Acidimicrobiales bacterium]